MRRVFLALALSVMTGGAALAALPPDVQQDREVSAILAHSAVKEAFKDKAIDSIEVIGWDLYRVSSGNCHMDVTVLDDPDAPKVPGPRAFLLEPGPLVCDSD